MGMRHGGVRTAIAVMGLAHGLWADVTMRHTMRLEFGEGMPAAAVEAVRELTGVILAEGTTVRIKGERVYATMGPLGAMTDYANGTITVMDPKGKRVARSTLAEYAKQVAEARKARAGSAEVQKAFDGLKVEVSVEKPERRKAILGIAAEERVWKMAIQVPGMPGPGMRVHVRAWVAGPEEVKGNAGLREVAAYSARAKNGADPLELLAKAFSSMPAVSEKMRAPMEEMMKSGEMEPLAIELDYFLPALGENEASMKFGFDLAEFSTAAIEEEVFAVPAGYRTVGMGELLKMLFPGDARR